MELKDQIENEYFNWLCDLVCKKRYSKEFSYRKLLTLLHNTEFTFTIKRDINRAKDGISLRDRFADQRGYDDIDLYLEGPCSILEMMVSLAIRMEETIMDNPLIGDRTAQWFWNMVGSLGLGAMYDSHFDKMYVTDTITRFLDRDYEPDGKGGLFTIKHCESDLRDVEIWYQLCWYLGTIT